MEYIVLLCETSVPYILFSTRADRFSYIQHARLIHKPITFSEGPFFPLPTHHQTKTMEATGKSVPFADDQMVNHTISSHFWQEKYPPYVRHLDD